MEEALKYFKGNDLAASVWKSKYAKDGELTPDDMHRRMAKEFAKIEQKYQSIMQQGNIPNDIWNNLSWYGRHRNELTEESIFELFKNFGKIIPQGSVMSQLGSNSIGSLSNCFVIGQPEDSYGGIFQKDEELVQLMKRRGGVGIDISTLRPNGTPTTNAAKTSTGAVSFMHRFSNSTREVAQNGRRGALMISIDINHPDVLDFIKIKRDLTQVTGANISIKLNNDFMKAVKYDLDYILSFPCNMSNSLKMDLGHIAEYDWDNYYPYNELIHTKSSNESEKTTYYLKRIRAKEYWNEIIKSAHNVAEPGLMFWDNMVNYAPDGVYEQYNPITTNPCSEIAMQPYDACRLIAVNLINFVKNRFTEKAYFDFNEFYNTNYEAMRLSDDLVDLELEQVNTIIDKIIKDGEKHNTNQRELELWLKILETAKSSRRTGLGFTALGDTLAALNIKYDSDLALDFIKQLMRSKMNSELDCTIDLAILRGSFIGWDKHKEFFNENIGFDNTTPTHGNNDFYTFLLKEFPEQAKRMYNYGRRNVSWSTCAPTGTVSLLANNCTGGIEPLFSPYYFRRKKINSNDKASKVDFVDQNGDSWQEYAVLHPYFQEWMITSNCCDEEGMNKHLSGEYTFSKSFLEHCFNTSPYYGSIANDINWLKRVEIQSIIQKYITHSISSTINLPETVKENEVSEIYFESWKKGLKGITVYRDKSRTGVLVTDIVKKDTFDYNDTIKRPKEVDADYYYVTSKGKKYAVIVGTINGKPYELFAFENPEYTSNIKGKIVKLKKGVYKFISDIYTIDNLQLSSEHTDERLLTRFVSGMLRHGMDPKYIVEQISKSELSIVSFGKAVSRVLSKYVHNLENTEEVCPECKEESLISEEGCIKCINCGYSKCG